MAAPQCFIKPSSKALAIVLKLMYKKIETYEKLTSTENKSFINALLKSG